MTAKDLTGATVDSLAQLLQARERRCVEFSLTDFALL